MATAGPRALRPVTGSHRAREMTGKAGMYCDRYGCRNLDEEHYDARDDVFGRYQSVRDRYLPVKGRLVHARGVKSNVDSELTKTRSDFKSKYDAWKLAKQQTEDAKALLDFKPGDQTLKDAWTAAKANQRTVYDAAKAVDATVVKAKKDVTDAEDALTIVEKEHTEAEKELIAAEKEKDEFPS